MVSERKITDKNWGRNSTCLKMGCCGMAGGRNGSFLQEKSYQELCEKGGILGERRKLSFEGAARCTLSRGDPSLRMGGRIITRSR